MSFVYTYVLEQRVAERLVSLSKAEVRARLAYFEYFARNPGLVGQDWAWMQADVGTRRCYAVR